MTAMRIAGIATITAVILAAASLLWQTEVPDDLVLRTTQGSELPGAGRAEEYGDGLRLLWLGGLAAQLSLAGLLAWSLCATAGCSPPSMRACRSRSSARTTARTGSTPRSRASGRRAA